MTNGEIFRLDRDVQNPKPDRRTKNEFHLLPVWEKGTRFWIYKLDDEIERISSIGNYGMIPLDQMPKSFRWALVPDKSPESLLIGLFCKYNMESDVRRLGSHFHILLNLQQEGKITFGDIEEHLRKLNE